jgi:uncharacterized membrane protein
MIAMPREAIQRKPLQRIVFTADQDVIAVARRRRKAKSQWTLPRVAAGVAAVCVLLALGLGPVLGLFIAALAAPFAVLLALEALLIGGVAMLVGAAGGAGIGIAAVLGAWLLLRCFTNKSRPSLLLRPI